MTQIRNFVFTLNNPAVEDYDALFCIDYQYLIFGEETASSGTYHLQGYCELTKRVSFAKLKKLLRRCWFAPRAGSQAEAIKYCKKEGLYHEFGEPRKQGRREDILAIRDHIEEGNNIRSMFVDDGEIIVNANTIRIAEKLFKYFEPPRDYKPTVLWFYGPTGCGKTRTARELLPDAYFSSNSTGKWWNGYDGHQDVIIDDIREDSICYKNILGLLDRYPYQVEDKYGIRQFRGKRIIVTAPWPPSETYVHTTEDKGQLARRIDHVVQICLDDDFYEEDLKDMRKWLEEEVGEVLPLPTSV